MKVTTNKYLNARIGGASTYVSRKFFRSPGDTIEIDDVLLGTEIDGNSIWYHCKDDGCYYWSGGIEETEFEMNLNSITNETKMFLINEAIQRFWNYWKKTIKGFTGASADLNSIDNSTENCLSFQLLDISEKIPGNFFYKGISITTKAIQTTFANPEIASPGSSISRIKEVDECGSICIKVHRKEGDDIVNYVITNYHVVAFDLIRSKELQYKFPPAIPNRQILVPAQKHDLSNEDFIGAFSEGRLSAFYDIALVRLRDSQLANNKVDGFDIAEFLDVPQNPKDYIGKNVTLYGAVSGKQSNTLRSVLSNQIFSYPGNTNVELLQLLQITKYSQPGDSGGPVLFQNKIIGIHVGADDTFSYAIPIKRILNFFNLKISQS